MDVFAVLASILALCLGGMLAQTTEIPEVHCPCKNARGLNGSCVPRRLCDHGTPAIDQTVYAPKGFKNPCAPVNGNENADKIDKICCPYGSQVTEKVESTTKSWETDAFDDFNK